MISFWDVPVKLGVYGDFGSVFCYPKLSHVASWVLWRVCMYMLVPRHLPHLMEDLEHQQLIYIYIYET